VLPVAARRWVLTDNTFWHARWDLIDYINYFIDYIYYFIDYIDYFLRLHRLQPTASSSSATSTSIVKMPNENPITYKELSDEHKQADLIGSFERTHHHGIRWKGFSSEGALDEVDLSTPTEERTRALRQEVNYMVAHLLHRHSKVLVNTLERVAVRVV
jgi:cellulose synthase/poly-beta-1,6-N-acetylglucosamine synthase-like glycosyltransferase